MSVNRKPTIADGALAILLADFALPAQHVVHAKNPASPAHALLGPAAPGQRTIGRPYSIWKDDLELAREINERLAPAGQLRGAPLPAAC
jgi:hypothetical protein